jgi:hypothetical protein
MSNPTVNHGDGHAAIAASAAHHGFLSPAQVAIIGGDPATRLKPLLVRCGGCRFTAPAQDVAHLIEIITRDGHDHVRDVALVASYVY